MKKKITIFILLLAVTAAVLGVSRYTSDHKTSASYIEKQVAEYVDTENWNEGSIPSVYTDDSAEVMFSTGMKYFADNQFKKAEECLIKALELPYDDDLLPLYANIYLNECSVQNNGIGNVAYVERALDQLADSPRLENRSSWVWELVYSLNEANDPHVSAGELLERYIKNAQNLSKSEELQLNSYDAVLKNINGRYSESMMMFYDILNQAKDLPVSYAISKTKGLCINYIADMYYSSKDYDRAIHLYQQLLHENIMDPSENAELKYIAALNVANIYLQKKDYEHTKNMITEIEKLLPYLDENTSREINAFLANISANIALDHGNFTEAENYFSKCEEFMNHDSFEVLFDAEIYFQLTRCRMLKQTGDLWQAEIILNQLLDGTITEETLRSEVREKLVEIYRLSGQKDKYMKEQAALIQEQQEQIKQYQADYCEMLNYYDQLVSLRKAHNASTQKNDLLIVILFVAILLLVFIIKVSLTRYHDSLIDALSGLYNRKQLDKEVTFYNKNNHKLMSYGIIMADIDFFKKYNDTYGHAAGDEVIRRVAAVLKRSVREKDIVIRYGGEEFLILLKDINTSTVESIADRICANIKDEAICHSGSDCCDYVSLSVGCFFVENTSTISLFDAIKEADKALYTSKQHGRNQVTIC